MDTFKGFVIAAGFGGPHTGVDDDIPLLKRLLESNMRVTRVAEVESVHLIFWVDGPLVAYHREKAEKLRRNRSRREISIVLGVPMSAWEGRTRPETRLFLGECVEAALELLIARAKKDKLCDGCELLWGDWERTKRAFLSHP